MFSYLATTHALWSYSNLPAQRTILQPMLLHKTPCFYIPELRVHIEPIRYEHLSRLDQCCDVTMSKKSTFTMKYVCIQFISPFKTSLFLQSSSLHAYNWNGFCLSHKLLLVGVVKCCRLIVVVLTLTSCVVVELMCLTQLWAVWCSVWWSWTGNV